MQSKPCQLAAAAVVATGVGAFVLYNMRTTKNKTAPEGSAAGEEDISPEAVTAVERGRKADKNVNEPLCGPPYRWLLPDCRCFYSENLYIKNAAGKQVDAYFILTSLETTNQQFWTDNMAVRDKSGNPLDKLTEAVKQDILAQVRSEAGRRRQVSSQYRSNFTVIAQKYKPLYPALFKPFEPSAAAAEPDLAPGITAQQVCSCCSHLCCSRTMQVSINHGAVRTLATITPAAQHGSVYEQLSALSAQCSSLREGAGH